MYTCVYIYVDICNCVFISGGTTCAMLLVQWAFLRESRFKGFFVRPPIATHVALKCIVFWSRAG